MPSRTWFSLTILWMAGVSLRLTVLAVPPLLPAIHHELHLSETLVGALTGLPVLLLALGAIPGSLLIAHVGPRRALIAGLVVLALAGAARGAGSVTPVLFAMTFLMGVGIAVSQPALPTLVRAWTPARVGLATAVFSNGFLMGEIIAASLTVPIVLPLAGGRWQIALAAWSIPALLTAAASLAAPRRPVDVEAPPMRWWPDWHDARIWRLGIIFGCASAGYFGANAFIPDYLKATHHAALIPAALTSLNLGQLPASLLVGGLSSLFIRRKWPLVIAGVLMVGSTTAFVFGGIWLVAAAAVLGFGTALVFVLVLALPPLLAPAHDVHRLSAGIFTLTYLCPFAGSLAGGVIWDASSVPITAFIPVGGAGLLLIALVAGLDLRSSSAPPGRSDRPEPAPKGSLA